MIRTGIPGFATRLGSDPASAELMARGMLAVPAGENVLRLLPPLNVAIADIAGVHDQRDTIQRRHR